MTLDKFYSLCLQGNVKNAIEYLQSLPHKDDEANNLLKKYEERFVKETEVFSFNTQDSWIIGVLSAYQSYFREALMCGNDKKAMTSLIQKLSQTVSKPYQEMSQIEDELKEIFQSKGYQYLGGATLPYYGPYIWKTTKKETFRVSLLEEEQEVTVFFISNFIMISWAHYATFGRHYAGGWSKPEGLYFVNAKNEDIDTGSTEFQVWFLKHEAQHLYDYKHFPNLDTKNLEYRAKLMELIYHPHPLTLIEKFSIHAKKDENVPHSYAGYVIIENLSKSIFKEAFVSDMERWKKINEKVISIKAKELFLEHTKELKKLGEKVIGFI